MILNQFFEERYQYLINGLHGNLHFGLQPMEILLFRCIKRVTCSDWIHEDKPSLFVHHIRRFVVFTGQDVMLHINTRLYWYIGGKMILCAECCAEWFQPALCKVSVPANECKQCGKQTHIRTTQPLIWMLQLILLLDFTLGFVLPSYLSCHLLLSLSPSLSLSFCPPFPSFFLSHWFNWNMLIQLNSSIQLCLRVEFLHPGHDEAFRSCNIIHLQSTEKPVIHYSRK